MTDIEIQIEQQKEYNELLQEELHDALEELEKLKNNESENKEDKDG